MIQNLLTNWKTTSAGLVMIIGSIIHLIFAIKGGHADEPTWTATFTAILAGIGLIAAGDGSTAVKAHQETLTQLEDIKSAVRTGDTSIIAKSETTPSIPPTPVK